jgi:hypothetical protein
LPQGHAPAYYHFPGAILTDGRPALRGRHPCLQSFPQRRITSLLKKASCLFQLTKSKKRGFRFSHKNLSGTNFHASPKGVIDTDIDHRIKGLKALDFAETSMFRCRQSKFGEYQLPAVSAEL